MNINWIVRIKNKNFWIAIVPALLLLVQQICALFGVSLELTGLSEQLLAIIGTVFAVLALLGVVNDPTTDGLSDSKQALTYDSPRKDGE